MGGSSSKSSSSKKRSSANKKDEGKQAPEANQSLSQLPAFDSKVTISEPIPSSTECVAEFSSARAASSLSTELTQSTIQGVDEPQRVPEQQQALKEADFHLGADGLFTITPHARQYWEVHDFGTLPAQPANTVTSVSFGGNSYSESVVESIAAALREQQISSAVLCNMFTRRQKPSVVSSLLVLRSLFTMDKLRFLDISDNALGPVGAEVVSSILLCNPSLESLHIENVGLGSAGGKILGKTLHSIAGSTCLTSLSIGRNRLEEGSIAIAEALASANRIQELSISQNGITPLVAVKFIQELQSCTQLRLLNLLDNTLTEEGAISLSLAVSNWRELRYLNVGDCLLRSGGALALINALSEGSRDSLEEFDASYNEITPMVVERFLSQLPNFSQLKKISLLGNEIEPKSKVAKLFVEACREKAILLDRWNEESDEDSEEEVQEEQEEQEQEEQEQEQETELAAQMAATTVEDIIKDLNDSSIGEVAEESIGQLMEEQSVEEQSVDEQSVEEQSAEEQSVEEQPVEMLCENQVDQPIEEQPSEEHQVEEQVAVQANCPITEQPMECCRAAADALSAPVVPEENPSPADAIAESSENFCTPTRESTPEQFSEKPEDQPPIETQSEAIPIESEASEQKPEITPEHVNTPQPKTPLADDSQAKPLAAERDSLKADLPAPAKQPERDLSKLDPSQLTFKERMSLMQKKTSNS